MADNKTAMVVCVCFSFMVWYNFWVRFLPTDQYFSVLSKHLRTGEALTRSELNACLLGAFQDQESKPRGELGWAGRGWWWSGLLDGVGFVDIICSSLFLSCNVRSRVCFLNERLRKLAKTIWMPAF